MSDTNTTKTIVVTGSTGLIGSTLVPALESAGHRVICAVRREVQNPEKEMHWNPAAGEIDRQRLEEADAVVHLAGANVAGRRWTVAYKEKLLNSRVQGTELLCEALASLDSKPRVLACASAIGFYGNRGETTLDDSATSGDGFLPELCMQWERACESARDAGIRVANMRIGVVLSPQGGALKKMLWPFRLGAGGMMGSGRQFFSWIALEDVVRAIEQVVEDNQLSGPINLVSPHAVTNREFTKTLARVLSRPSFATMPAFAIRLLFGEMGEALMLDSTRVVPAKLTAANFQFHHEHLEPALRHLLEKT